jgi:hypothetical protein
VAPRRARGRLRLPISARTRAVVALGVTLAVLGVGTMFGLRATSGAAAHDPPPPAAAAATTLAR